MLYTDKQQVIPQNKRADINTKILYVIDSQGNQIDKETIYNCYTGIGGLHDLQFSDFSSFHDFTEAKKEIELGQFFTPHHICKSMVDIIEPSSSDMIADLCCGMGNFFNWLPNLNNVHGIDIDFSAIKVAKHLYPNSKIKALDIRQYESQDKFDIVLGNPPFNLKFSYGGKEILSQFFYCLKAHEVMSPAGLLALIVPESFLADEFWNKSQVDVMNKNFDFIGQTSLPSDAFKCVGVTNFKTKIIIFRKRSENIDHIPYSTEHITLDELKDRIIEAKEKKKSIRLQLVQEAIMSEDDSFEFKLKKYLYELKAHPSLEDQYSKCLAYIEKFKNQTPPSNATDFEKWKKTRITEKKVLSRCKKAIATQNKKEKDVIRLVKTNYSYKIKAYSSKTKHILSNLEVKEYSINDLILSEKTLSELFNLPEPIDYINPQIKCAEKAIKRKRIDYINQSKPILEVERDVKLDEYLKNITFVNPKMEDCHFTKLQQHDMGLFFQKRYSLLNWQQGSGKTAVSYHYGKYLIDNNLVDNVFALAPALATNLTWVPFLQRNNVKYCIIKKQSDIDNISKGDFVVIANSMLGKLKKPLQLYMKKISNKGCLLFDESDEITNPHSVRTRATLDIFRRLRYKLLATGTTTRNNIAELYSQLELLYNNSVNMTCFCENVYNYNKDNCLESDNNDRYMQPYPPRGGAILFKSCFCPGKASVFGIEKLNQDVFNGTHLAELVDKTIITRKFKDFAGEKYDIKTHTVMMDSAESELYDTVVEDFDSIARMYFKSTGNSRTDSALRIVRMIQLLIKTCSTSIYGTVNGKTVYPTKAKRIGALISKMNEKVAIGCTTLDAVDMYKEYLSNKFPDRELFVVKGDIDFKKRDVILKKFEQTNDGILLCTQQSLKSSVNIPTCNQVILESLQWNIPKMEQFYFRAIRFDSEEKTTVHFVTYAGTIEQNILSLVLSKERINEFIKSGEVKEQSQIFEEFGISDTMLQSLMRKEKDEDGKISFTWGKQNFEK